MTGKRWKRIRKVSEDLFVVPFGLQSVLIYREGGTLLKVRLSEIAPLIKTLQAVGDDLASGTVSPDTILPRLDD